MKSGCSFLVALVAIAAALGVGAVIADVWDPGEASVSPERVARELEDSVAAHWFEPFEEELGISIVVADRDAEPVRGLTVRRAAPGRVAEFAPHLVRELNRYPPSFFRLAKVEYVVLCEGLAGWDHLRRPDQPLAGVAPELAVLLDVSSAGPTTIHHELFHMLDRARGTLHEDEEWRALQPEGFEYGPRTDAGHHAPPPPGFVTHYAATSLTEDKAETFAHLVFSPEAFDDADPVLTRKRDAMRELVEEFCPDLGTAFWERP